MADFKRNSLNLDSPALLPKSESHRKASIISQPSELHKQNCITLKPRIDSLREEKRCIFNASELEQGKILAKRGHSGAFSGNLSHFLQSNLKHQLLVCPRVVAHITAPEMIKPTLFSLRRCKATTGTMKCLKDQLQKEKYCKTDKLRISPDNKIEAMFGVLIFM